MEEKTAKDIASQLKRIADALEKKNTLTESEQKRKIKLEKLQEKNLRFDLKERVVVDPKKVIEVSPRLDQE